MTLSFRLDDLTGADVQDLLRRHLAMMAEQSPAESCQALDLSGLQASDVTFWSIWDDQVLVGCGALKELDSQHGEIKSMHTSTACRGRGIAAAMLEHIIEEARGRGYCRLSLETGSMGSFVPARMLYRKYGFSECLPFADYLEDSHSIFMTRVL